MECKHFGSCGSCSLYQIDYETQLKEKNKRISMLLEPFYQEEVTVFGSPEEHYRARAEFRIWHEGEVCSYAMGNLDKNGVVMIEECPKAIEAIEKRMWPLLEKVNASETLKTRLFSVEFLATTTDECLVTLLYHRKLDEVWKERAKVLESELNCKVLG